MDDLQEHFLGQGFEQTESFLIDCDEKANWALRKIRHLKDKMKKNEEFAKSEIERIQQWLEKENGSLQNSIQFFEQKLTEYAESLRKQDPKFKRLSLPNGKVSFRKQQPKWIIHNEDELVEKLQDMNRDDLLIVKQSVSLRAIKNGFAVIDGRVVDPDTGEVIEGIEIVQRPDIVKVEVSE